jgi:polyphosphate:AMP phosphotransferase
MFETAELGRTLDKDAYKERVPILRTRLLRAQNELYRDAPFSVVIVIGGVDGAGKGDTVNTLHEWMDPRYLETHAFGLPSEDERERPPMWRFWRALPPRGRMGIFFGSWYTQPIVRRVYGDTSSTEFESALARIKEFEGMLVADGTLVLKYWFHLSKKAQKQRLRKLSKDKEQAWRVGPQDWKHFELYDDFALVSERALRETSTGAAPWQVIEGTDARYREVTCGEHLLSTLRAQLDARAEAPQPEHPPSVRPLESVTGGQPTILSSINLAARVEKKDYEEQLAHLQARLNRLSRKAQKVGATMLCVFEGPDAAGKGGAIRRVTRALDARYYSVIPIAAPTDEERARHYLWRFWRHLPKRGRLVIFDRSWYGRVLVERVEGFARAGEWGRAYNEISEFEELLTEWGIGLAKFWLHIDQAEQERRFLERENTPYKEFKITQEDYRNREKWPLYELAVHEMVERTSSTAAPWTLVAANDKRNARLEVLRTTCETLEACIERAGKGAARQRSRGKAKPPRG